MQTFTVHDLRDKTGDLIREAESGHLSIVTKHGQPVFIAVPFDETLVREGVTIALATHLFDDEAISLGQAARLAGMGVTDFTEHLAQCHVPLARPRPRELEQEIDAFG